jgi:CubicO group peptidase (beta-lactamase class C family)
VNTRQVQLFSFLLILVLLLTGFLQGGSKVGNETVPAISAGVPEACLPSEVGMDAAVLSRIETIVLQGINARAFPGCQVLVVKDGKVVYDRSFGFYTYEKKKPVAASTLYDLASLSKTTGTLLAVMKLYDEGRLALDDKASKFLPFLRDTNKESITLRQLLFHESGLPPSLNASRLLVPQSPTSFNRISRTNYPDTLVSTIPSATYALQVSDSLWLHKGFHETAMQEIAHLKLLSKVYRYSCINFILLKEIAETISGRPMDIFLDSVFYVPMGLKRMTYLPLRTHEKNEIAPTLTKDVLREGVVQGFVHDPDAALLGGVSGNAGLFASARDVAMVYQMLLNNGELEGKRYVKEATCRYFTTMVSKSGRRGLGFDKPVTTDPLHSPCCPSAPATVYGHTGYTGTCCWVDPVNQLIYVFLSNRTFPSDGVNKLVRMGIRTKIQEIMYQALIKPKQ